MFVLTVFRCGSIKKFKSNLSSLAGNFIEYYDYTLYGFLATEINAHFFPPLADDKALAFVRVYGVFFLGFLAKPIGSIFLSKIGDLYGRKRALFISILGMLLSTFMIGFSPSYESIGGYAIITLIFARTLQGACISAEGDGVRVFAMEYWGEKKYCLANGFASLSCSGGIFAASYLASLVLDFGFSWQWLFIVGGFLSLFILTLRLSMDESPEFVRASIKEKPHSNWTSFKKNKTLITYMTLFAGLNGAIYYYLAVFINGYLADILGVVSQQEASKISNFYLLGYVAVTLLFGYFADKVDKIKLIKLSSLGLIISNMIMIINAQEDCYPLFLFLFMGVFTYGIVVPVMPLMMSLIKVTDRLRVLSIGHALGSMLLGGTAPLIGSLLQDLIGIQTITLLYPLILSGCYLLTAILFDRKVLSSSA